MAKFRKKPVVIEASQWFKDGDHPMVRSGGRNFTDIDHPYAVDKEYASNHGHKGVLVLGRIDTLEGGHDVTPGDWIITGIKGEHYPCKPDIFDATYEPAGE